MYYSPAYDRDEPCYSCGSVQAECECTLEIEERESVRGMTLQYDSAMADYNIRQLQDRIAVYNMRREGRIA